MTDLLNYIVWQPDLEAFRLGPIAVRWYGLMWDSCALVWTDVDHWSGAGLSGGTASL